MKLFAVVLPLFVLALAAGAVPVDPEEYLHPNSGVTDHEVVTPEGVESTVITSVVKYLEDTGGDDILVCRITRIEAPLGGWLVDGLAGIEIDGETYTTFRVGIEDSGEVFTLIARSVNDAGAIRWFPSMGPDYSPAGDEPFPEELLEFEFLLGRDDFEKLEQEFPRQVSCHEIRNGG